jgi:hypothetical protein
VLHVLRQLYSIRTQCVCILALVDFSALSLHLIISGLQVEVTRLGQLESGESTKLSLSAAHTASSTPVAASSGSSIGNMYDSSDIGATTTSVDTDAAATGTVAKNTAGTNSNIDAATAADDATAGIGQPLEVITRTNAAIHHIIVTIE